jgi:hypothetical protein
MKYLPQDYYDACKALETALDSFERGGTYGEVDMAEAKLVDVVAYLRANGNMPKTYHEILEESLDLLYPEAASRQIVEYEGKRYQRRFKPLKRGKGGGVVKWEKSWLPMF